MFTHLQQTVHELLPDVLRMVGEQPRGLQLVSALMDIVFRVDILSCATVKTTVPCPLVLDSCTSEAGSQGQVGSQSIVDEVVRLTISGNGLVELYRKENVSNVVGRIKRRSECLPSQNCCSLSKSYATSSSMLRGASYRSV